MEKFLLSLTINLLVNYWCITEILCMQTSFLLAGFSLCLKTAGKTCMSVCQLQKTEGPWPLWPCTPVLTPMVGGVPAIDVSLALIVYIPSSKPSLFLYGSSKRAVNYQS